MDPGWVLVAPPSSLLPQWSLALHLGQRMGVHVSAAGLDTPSLRLGASCFG